jgi:serine/threonine protein kinase
MSFHQGILRAPAQLSPVSSQVSMRYSGTVTHMPPELIEEGKVYQQGDVYAFGIMMWEVSMSLHVLHRY